MAGGDPRGARRSGRLRLLAGFSVVLGAVTLLLSTDTRGRGEGGMDGDRREAIDTGSQHGAPPSAEALKDGFELRDANTRKVGTIMAVSVAIIAISIVGLFFMLGLFHRQDRSGPPLTPQQQALIAPPGPPLQASPQYDIASLDRREVKLLSTYAWLSPLHAAARIPIDRAMALVVGKPFGPGQTPAAAPAGGSP